MAAKRWWRIRTTDTFVAGEYFGCSTIKGRETVGGTDHFAGKTITAYAFLAGYEPTKAVDGNDATFYTTGGQAPGPDGHWLLIDLGAGNEKDLKIFEFTSRSDGIREDPVNLFIESGDTAADLYPVVSAAGYAAWTAGETRTLTRVDSAALIVSKQGAAAVLSADGLRMSKQGASVLLHAADLRIAKQSAYVILLPVAAGNRRSSLM